MFYEIDLRMFKNVYKSSTKIFMQVALEISPVSNLRYGSKENASFSFSVRLTVAGLSRPRFFSLSKSFLIIF